MYKKHRWVPYGSHGPHTFYNFSIGIGSLPYKLTMLSLCGPSPVVSTILCPWLKAHEMTSLKNNHTHRMTVDILCVIHCTYTHTPGYNSLVYGWLLCHYNNMMPSYQSAMATGQHCGVVDMTHVTSKHSISLLVSFGGKWLVACLFIQGSFWGEVVITLGPDLLFDVLLSVWCQLCWWVGWNGMSVITSC